MSRDFFGFGPAKNGSEIVVQSKRYVQIRYVCQQGINLSDQGLVARLRREAPP
jgi:hypothetical protein